MYSIIRHYSRPDPQNPNGHLQTKRRTIETRLTLEEAQSHCSDPKTSTMSGTAKPKRGGWEWFDGYTET